MTASTHDRVEPRPAPPPHDAGDPGGRRRIPRAHLIGLAIIAVAGLLRGLFWVGVTEVWNPTDEAHHASFVMSLATGDGIPTVGKDIVPVEIIEVEKASPTLPFRSLPHAPVLDDPYWEIEASQYEGVQPPLYYVLLVPFYWLSRPFGFVASIYGMRIGSVLLALTAVPLTWLLARELFPRRPAVWLAAPAVLVAINGFNANLASIKNDAIVVPVAAIALIAATRFFRSPTPRRAALTGLALGVALLAKTSAIGLVPLLALPFLALAITRRLPLAGVLKTGAITGACAGLVLLPWVAWNMATYGDPTAAAAADAITGQFMTHFDLSRQVVVDHARLANSNFWDFELLSPLTGASYQRVFVWAALAAAVLGVGAALARRERGTAVALGWTALALPLAFIGMESITFGVFGGVGNPQGRHLYIALVPVSILIAAAAVVALGPRWGLVAVAAVLALALHAEQAQVRDYVSLTYASGRIEPDLAPVVDQSLNMGFRAVTTVRVDPPCPVRAIGLLVGGDVPATLTVDGVPTPLTGSAAEIGTRPRFADNSTQVYSLATPVSQPFEVVSPTPFLVGTSVVETSPHLALTEAPGDPTARLYCQVDDSERVRFEQQFPVQHPSQLTYGNVRLWPRLWAVLGIGLVVVAVGAALKPRGRRARAGQP